MKILKTLFGTSAVVMAASLGGIGLSSASATVATQMIMFTSVAPTSATYGSSYAVSATASSGLPVTLTVDSTTTSVCSISGSKVTFIGIGTCTIDANQPGNAEYAPAPQVQQSVIDGQAAGSITFTSTAPVTQVSGGPSYIVAASSPSTLPITFAVAPASGSVCTVSGPTSGSVAGSTGTVAGATVNFIGAGICTINADEAGNAYYLPATEARQSISVAMGLQKIQFGFTAAATGAKVGASYQLRANTVSGLTIGLSVAPNSAAVCSLSTVSTSGGFASTTVKFTGAGTCTIDGNQAGNATYAPAPLAQESFTVAKAKAKSLTVAAKSEKRKLAVSGKLSLPAGVAAARGYSGKVTVTATKGGKTLSTTTTKLSKAGRYSVTLGAAAAATAVTVKFGGNAVLVASSTKKTV